MTLPLLFKRMAFRVAPGITTEIAGTLSNTRRSEATLVRTAVRSGRGALDIGASWGLFTYLLSQTATRVDAFEPVAEKAAYLRSLGLPNCNVHEVALSDRTGSAELFIPYRKSACATVERNNPIASPARSTTETVSVALRPLDNFELEDVGFIKIDVEGHELSVLQGGQSLIARDRPILFVEIERRHNIGAFDATFQFLDLLEYRAFACSHFELMNISRFDVDRDQPLGDIASAMQRGTYIYNFLFVPKGESEITKRLERAGFHIRT